MPRAGTEGLSAGRGQSPRGGLPFPEGAWPVRRRALQAPVSVG